MKIVKNFEEKDNKICIAQIDSKVGMLKFLVVGLDKKRVNEADLSFAYSESQEQRLPVLFAISGRLTKKAEEYLRKLGDYVKVIML